MKNRLYKVLSIVLSVTMLLSVCFVSGIINAVADTTGEVREYYVKGDTGVSYTSTDTYGTVGTQTTPYASVYDVIQAVNADTAFDVEGNTFNVWIMQDFAALIANKDKTYKVSNKTYITHNMACWAQVGTANTFGTHNAKMVIDAHEDNVIDTTGATAPKYTYLAITSLVGSNAQMIFGGPTKINNVNIAFMSSSNATDWRRSKLVFAGNDVELGASVTHSYTPTINSSTSASWNATLTDVDAVIIDIGRGTAEYTDPVEVNIYNKINGNTGNGRIYLPSLNASAVKFKENVTLNILSSSVTTGRLNISSSAHTTLPVFEKDINVKIAGAKGAWQFGNDAGNAIVKGGIHLIKSESATNRGDSWPWSQIYNNLYTEYTDADNNTPITKHWIVTVDDANIDLINFSETGKFAIHPNYVATATNTKTGATKDSENGILDLNEVGAGEYTVAFTKQASKVWDYYVKAGGEGDGTDENNPAPDVATALATMESLGLTAEETANIWIMQNDMTDITCGDDMTHNMAYWGATVEHKATVNIKAHQDNTYSGDVITNTLLAISNKINSQGTLTFGGPTVIGNVQLVYTTVSALSSESKAILNFNGKDVTISADAKFAYINANGDTTYASDYADADKAGGAYKTVGWPSTVTNHFNPNSFLNAWVTSNTGDAVTYPNPINITFNRGFSTTSANGYPRFLVGASNDIFNEDVNINLDAASSGNTMRVRLGYSSYGATFNKNLNFKIISSNSFGFDPKANITVNGGIQLILSDTATFHSNNPYDNFDNKAFKADGSAADSWILKVPADNINDVNFVDGEKGKFTAIKDGCVATAVSLDKSIVVKANENGLIDLSKNVGEYTIIFAEEETETHNYDQGEKPYINYRGFGEFSGVTTTSGEAIDNKGALANTYKKLTQDKELNVVYFGGSVTNGTGSTTVEGQDESKPYCWRARIGQWLVNNFPAAKVKNINKAIGETGTYLGCYRVARDIVSEAPDLLFIEYSINDKYDFASYDRASMQFETIVRTVKEAYPDCDIVTVLVTDSDVGSTTAKEGTLHKQAQAHEDISQIYDIPSLHVGRVFADKVWAEGWRGGTKGIWLDYMTDMVHPKDVGYDVYYQVIKEFMANCLLFSNYSECTYEVKNQELPELFNKYLFDGEVTYIEEYNENSDAVTYENNGNIFHSPEMQGVAYPDYVGLLRVPAGCQDIITVKFTGTELIMLMKHGNSDVAGNKYSVSIDGGEWVSYDYVAKNPIVLAKGLEDRAHVAQIKVSPEEKLITLDYRISGFYSRSVIKATNKLSITDLVALDESISDTTLNYRDYNNDDIIDTKDITTLRKILLNNKSESNSVARKNNRCAGNYSLTW